MRKVWLFALLLGAALVSVAVRPAQGIQRVEMASETDGVHQDDHLDFGLVPYSTQRPDPRLEVTKDAFEALRRTGVPDLPESHRRLPSYPVVRTIRPNRTE